MNKRIGLIGLCFFIIENSYFGWNWSPQSLAEIICDGIGLTIFAIAFWARKVGGQGANP